jgi:phosphomannomutase/phosphoglucomutase
MIIEPSSGYHCPGESHPISRAIHLARLASFYPMCSGCAHGDDTGTLSPRLVKLLAQTRRRERDLSLFTAEGVTGVYLNTLTAPQTRELAAAFGLGLPLRDGNSEQVTDDVVVAGDGRPLTSELVAAACDGLRWTGRRVVDLGAATAPCVAWAVEHLRAAGGVLVGNAGDEPQTIGLKFWQRHGRPISAGPELDRVRQLYEAGVDRPCRTYGALRRFQPDRSYLAGFEDHFHALRPLRFVLDTQCQPLIGYLRAMTAESACDVVHDQGPGRQSTTRRGLAERVRRADAHFGLWIGSDGEACRLVDQCGLEVRHDEWLWLNAKRLLELQPGATIVLENEANVSLAERINSAGGQVVFSDAARAAMDNAMREHAALAGGGPSGRLWFGGEAPAADILKALALLLTVMSQSDRSLSELVCGC